MRALFTDFENGSFAEFPAEVGFGEAAVERVWILRREVGLDMKR